MCLRVRSISPFECAERVIIKLDFSCISFCHVNFVVKIVCSNYRPTCDCKQTNLYSVIQLKVFCLICSYMATNLTIYKLFFLRLWCFCNKIIQYNWFLTWVPGRSNFWWGRGTTFFTHFYSGIIFLFLWIKCQEKDVVSCYSILLISSLYQSPVIV